MSVDCADWEIIQGDCLEVMAGMADASVDVVVTSPPFNLVREWSGGGPHSNQRRLEERYEWWYEDDMPEEEYQAWQRRVVEECLRVARGSVFYNHKVRYAHKRRGRAYHPMEWLSGLPLWCEIIWQRGAGRQANQRRFPPADERVYMFGRPHTWHAIGCSNIWSFAPTPNSVHPCSFTPELPRRCILAATDPGDAVLDPFCGIGTAGVVALELGRRFVGIDLKAEYCALARDAMAAAQKPIPGLLTTGC